MVLNSEIKVEKLVGAPNWAKWEWHLNMHFEQYTSVIDGSRKCPNITNIEKTSEDYQKICWCGNRIILDGSVNHKCAESTSCVFGIDVQ